MPAFVAVGTLLIRADAGAHVGVGHVLRCLSLADAWIRRGGDAVFASTSLAPELEARVRDTGARILPAPDLDGLVRLARTERADVCVLDGYQFDAGFQRVLAARGPLLCIDDFGHAKTYAARWVLDQNVGAREDDYAQRAPGTQLLLGSRYVLLRQEFVGRANEGAEGRVLVTLGGGDAANVTAKVLDSLERLDRPGLEVRVLVGAANPHRESLRRRAHARVQVLVTPPSVADQLAWATVAVSASGTTAWELAAMGVPSLQFFVAENQRRNTEQLAALGICRGLGSPDTWEADALALEIAALLDDRAARSEMAAKGRALVDGLGAERVCDALLGVNS